MKEKGSRFTFLLKELERLPLVRFIRVTIGLFVIITLNFKLSFIFITIRGFLLSRVCKLGL